jgi:hypothetical protein
MQHKISKYLNKLSNENIQSEKFGLYLTKLNYWYQQYGGAYDDDLQNGTEPEIIKKIKDDIKKIKNNDKLKNICESIDNTIYIRVKNNCCNVCGKKYASLSGKKFENQYKNSKKQDEYWDAAKTAGKHCGCGYKDKNNNILYTTHMLPL